MLDCALTDSPEKTWARSNWQPWKIRFSTYELFVLWPILKFISLYNEARLYKKQQSQRMVEVGHLPGGGDHQLLGLISKGKGLEMQYLLLLQHNNSGVTIDQRLQSLSQGMHYWYMYKYMCMYNDVIFFKWCRPKHPTKVHVWAAISMQGRGAICVFDGIMNKEFLSRF